MTLSLVATATTGCWFVVDSFEDGEAPAGAGGSAGQGGATGGLGGLSGASGQGGLGGLSGASGQAGLGGLGGAGGVGGSGGGTAGTGGSSCQNGGVLRCSDDKFGLVRCGPDGQPGDVEGCPANQPYCVDNSKCAQCRGPDDTVCPDVPDDCRIGGCSASYTCVPKPAPVDSLAKSNDATSCVEKRCDGQGGVKSVNRPEGSSCLRSGETGLCNDKGVCVECLTNACASNTTYQACTNGQLSKTTTACNASNGELVCNSATGTCGGVVQISSRNSSACAVLDGGDLLCWGDNTYGQLGLGLSVVGMAQRRPIRVTGLGDVKQVSVGTRHSCAVTHDQDLFCWGTNKSRAVSEEDDEIVTTPRQVPGKYLQVEVSASTLGFTCAIRDDGAVLCWGYMSLVEGFDKPTVHPLAGTAIQIGVGVSHACARMQSGQVHCWGSNKSYQLGSPDTTDKVFQPYDFSLTPDWTFAFGDDVAYAYGTKGTCGWGNITSFGASPVTFSTSPVKCSESGYNPKPGTLFLGSNAVAFLTGLGTAISLNGENTSGRLCKEKATSSSCNVYLSLVKGVTIGAYHTCAWQDKGKAWCWGSNSSGQLGIDSMAAEALDPTEIKW